MANSSVASYRRWAAAVLGFFAVCYALLALYNHYAFRTYAFDLGIFNQAQWDYAHGRLNVNSVLRYNNLLGDHFMVLQLAWAPLYRLFGSYSLLLVQLAAVLLGGYGAYRLHVLRSAGQQPAAAVAQMAQFLSIWGIFSALAFDFHDNVVAAMLLPWLVYFFEQDRRTPTLLVFAAMVLCKENMALWLAFVCAGLAWLHWRVPRRRWLALGLAVVGVLYAAVVIKWVIPAFSEGRPYYHQHSYAALGSSPAAIIGNLLTHPAQLFQLVFQNTLPNTPEADGIKLELFLMVLLSGGLALLRRPAYLLMVAPIFAQKLLSSQFVHWGLNYQYSIEFVPVLNMALGHWLLQARPRRAGQWGAAAALLTLAATITSLEVRVSKWHDKSASQFYLPRHYRRGFDVGTVHRALRLIPDTAAVTASSALVPHLTARPYIFCFPEDVARANYVALLLNDGATPLSEAEYQTQIAAFRASPEWRVRFDQETLLILERVQPLPTPPRRYFARRINDPATP
ncbi:DUF2079 domain-containing protein [Hymenobacter busanensis]|uniref:DUF2079 domain-containing protein n=1 Tax=Hymenobacter busanensis TaxID=2607656 RepID=A0A7L4ZZN8_9BACT|nr:DUF2079 domain-containing protein [Hymenobacter busanensis]KAA9331344.1 DUF2079 domain-containing protein [Hymenobacter busanensis]QHJ08497.1 DUF2079 domain-containing protein [Hymenobacter busanensis]